jgi:hypothetical protein
MKTRKITASVIFIITVLVVIGIFINGSKSYKKASVEDLYGTWVNEDYVLEPGSIGAPRSKLIINHDGTIESYETHKRDKTTEVKREPWTYTVTDSWVDSNKNSWYKLFFKRMGFETSYEGTQYCLLKLSNSNRTLEIARYSVDYPAEIDPNSIRYSYRIYYRQE